MTLDSPQLVQILKDPAATVFQKDKACMRLAMVGTKDAVPALAALLGDPQFSHYARFGLVPIPDPSVDDALRGALKTLKGKLLVGVIDSIGQRKDAKAVEPLAKMMYDTDAEVAQAAAATLGRISGPQATKALQDGLAKTKGPARTAVAAAGLVCAEGLLAQGDRKGALALFGALSRPDMPRSVRLAAMHSTIAVETALGRPR
jgi:HEAT repeat protein